MKNEMKKEAKWMGREKDELDLAHFLSSELFSCYEILTKLLIH